MIKPLLEALLRIGIIVPFAIIFLKERNKINFKRIAIFIFCYLIYNLILVLGLRNNHFIFSDSHWNWTGKILGILWGITCYFLFKKYFADNNFFTLKQNKKNFKKALTAGIAIGLFTMILSFFAGKSKFDFETLTFQLTLPGIDEEIMFRGILLCLLASSLKGKIFFLGNPSIFLTSVLFGLMHALTMTKNYSFTFDPIYFIYTTTAGYIFGWTTIKSRSILLAIFSHGFTDFSGSFVRMVK